MSMSEWLDRILTVKSFSWDGRFELFQGNHILGLSQCSTYMLVLNKKMNWDGNTPSQYQPNDGNRLTTEMSDSNNPTNGNSPNNTLNSNNFIQF